MLSTDKHCQSTKKTINFEKARKEMRLLEMPWPKGRHLKMLVSAPGQVAVILSMCTDWKFYIWIGQLKFDLQL